ncbi:MAG: hypothetical protein HQ521_21910 [Bacteroidetes bacterium]|nr:hypothetical protein [Bacteroidota bacterium]
MSSKYKYLLLAFVFLSILPVNLKSQITKFKNVEQVQLVTDREFYVSGEPIWYTVSYSLADDNPTDLSKVLYIELFDNDLKVVASQKVSIYNGLAEGKILIPEQSATGYYLLRAYTRYQENFPVYQMATEILSVVNPTHPLSASAMPGEDEQISINVMPNGNTAFRLKGPIIKEVDSVELIVNGLFTNYHVDYFKNGIGSFDYEIQSNDELQLLIKLNSGDTISSKIISPKIQIGKLTKERIADEIVFTISGNNLIEQELHFSVLNVSGNELFRSRVNMIGDTARVNIPISMLDSDLFLLAITDSEENIIHSSIHSIVLNQVSKHANSAVNTIESGGDFSIDLSDIESSDYPIGVSVALSGTISQSPNLLPDYLLNNPQYFESYFDSYYLDENIIHQLEIVLALNGNNIFNRMKNSIVNKEFVVPELVGLTLQGQVINSTSGESISNELVFCSFLGNKPQFHTARTLNNGRFVVPLNDITGLYDIYLGTDLINGTSDVEILIDNGFCKELPIWVSTPFLPDTSQKELITQMYINHQINILYGVERLQIQENIKKSRLIFGDNLHSILLTDYVQLSSVPEVINEIVPSVRARKKDGHYSLIVLDDQLFIKYDNPLLFVDQVPYYNIDELMELQPTEIELIEVAPHKYMYGNEQFNGIISITTNTGNFAGLPLSDNGVFVEYRGLENNVEFIPFSSEVNNSGKPDFANTIYWKTFVAKSTKAKIPLVAPSSIGDYDLKIISLNNNKILVNKKLIVK